MATNEPVGSSSERDLVLHRDLDAPRVLVWAALTDPSHLANWWGPTGFITETHSYDLVPGGAWHMTMHGPDGRPYLNHAIFEEVEAPHRLVLRYVDAEGGERAMHNTTITLTELSPGRTRLTLAMRFPTAEARAVAVDQYGAVEGGRQTLGRLATFLEGTQGAAASASSFVLRRVLPVAPEKLWEVWTQAEHLQRWFHPESWKITSCELDLRVGGSLFYGMEGPQMPLTWALWRFTALEALRRLAFELSFADPERRVTASPFGGPWPARLATTVTFEPHAGIGRGTVLTLTSTPLGASDEEVAAFVAMFSSMEMGWGQTLDALAAHVGGASA